MNPVESIFLNENIFKHLFTRWFRVLFIHPVEFFSCFYSFINKGYFKELHGGPADMYRISSPSLSGPPGPPEPPENQTRFRRKL